MLFMVSEFIILIQIREWSASKNIDPVYTVSNSGGTWRGGYRAHHARRASNPSEGSEAISGSQRVKYFKRPILPYVQAVPPEM